MARMLCHGVKATVIAVAHNQVTPHMSGWFSGGQTLVERRGMPSVYF